jgi:putative N6-adenine-specific DNA methylase
MCGSGTFSLEAAMMSRNLPGGWFREFAFMGWPAFSPGRWRHLRREAEQRIVPDASGCIFASDSRDRSVTLLREHLSAAGLSNTVNAACLDFFDLTPKGPAAFGGAAFGITSDPGLIVLNPPYGRRLGSVHEARVLFSDIFNKLRRDFKGWKIAVIVPESLVTKRLATTFERHALFHGGLALVLLTGRV